MIGVGIQEGFILLFCFFAARFHLTLRQEINTPFSAKYKPLRILSLLYCLYLVLALITVSFFLTYPIQKLPIQNYQFVDIGSIRFELYLGL